MIKDKKDLRCLYCNYEMMFHETSWTRDKRRCIQCGDSKLKEIKETKNIDTYPKGFDESVKEWKEKNSKAKQEAVDKKADNEEIDGLDFGKYFGYD